MLIRDISDSPDRLATQDASLVVNQTQWPDINCEFGEDGRDNNMTGTFDISTRFTQLVAAMKLDGRYRTFVQLERIAGEFPIALWHHPDGSSRRVTVWCSNDYLGMGQHPDVLAAMRHTLDVRRRRRHPKYIRH